MPLEIDNLTELQKLREATLAQKNPLYKPGTIPVAEIAAANGVTVRTMVAAYQTNGQRPIDDLSLLTPETAAAAEKVLRIFEDLKDPVLAKMRRDGHVPVAEFAADLGEPLEFVLDVCIIAGFSERIANVDLWLDTYEQGLVRARVQKHRRRLLNNPFKVAKFPEATVMESTLLHTAPFAEPEDPTPPDLPAGSANEPSPHAIGALGQHHELARLNLFSVDSGVVVQQRILDAEKNHRILESTIESNGIDFDDRRIQHLLSDKTPAVASTGPTYKTDIGSSANAIRDLQKTLDTFAPTSYGVFFHHMREALRIDERIQRTMPSRTSKMVQGTDRTSATFIHEVCAYKYGIFAYRDIGFTLGKKASRSLLPNRKTQQESLHKFRPMLRGLVTDESRRQFILWRVGKGAPDFLVIKWDHLNEWLDEMANGQYRGLRTKYINTAAKLEDQDQSIVKLMIEMADNLRRGARSSASRQAASPQASHRQLNGQRTTAQRTLGYKPQNEWLVPITVNGRNVTTGLEEDFFIAHGGKRPHAVREFSRRSPGSPLNSPRNVIVQGHTRGARQFPDAKILPSVTIKRQPECRIPSRLSPTKRSDLRRCHI